MWRGCVRADGTWHGPVTLTEPDGSTWTGTMFDGLQHGPWIQHECPGKEAHRWAVHGRTADRRLAHVGRRRRAPRAGRVRLGHERDRTDPAEDRVEGPSVRRDHRGPRSAHGRRDGSPARGLRATGPFHGVGARLGASARVAAARPRARRRARARRRKGRPRHGARSRRRAGRTDRRRVEPRVCGGTGRSDAQGRRDRPRHARAGHGGRSLDRRASLARGVVLQSHPRRRRGTERVPDPGQEARPAACRRRHRRVGGEDPSPRGRPAARGRGRLRARSRGQRHRVRHAQGRTAMEPRTRPRGDRRRSGGAALDGRRARGAGTRARRNPRRDGRGARDLRDAAGSTRAWRRLARPDGRRE